MTVKQAFPGTDLRQRREELGYTVDDVYRKIRVSPTFIRALEAGDMQQMPAPCYAVGFLRTYCQFLELDPDRYIDIYHDATKPSGRFLRRTDTNQIMLPPWMNEVVTWAAVCGIIVLGWVTYAVVVRPAADPGDQRVHAGTTDEDLVVPSAPVNSGR